MKFPVDLLADVSKAQLENLAQEYYMNTLLYSQHDSSEYLTLPDTTQVTISVSSTGFVPFHGQNEKNKILVLFSPSDLKSAIALYLLDRWWTVEDILKTADPARRGVLPVDTVGERIVLYILNRIIYRGKEMIAEELPFLCHGENDHAKILWEDGEAVGFYSVKPTGSMYKRFSTQTYQLPVMDSIFVRKCHRGKGSGLLMLKDFVLSFSEVSLGLKYPLSNSMYRVCEKYLCEYPEHADLLWEVESIGGPYQRTNIASKIQVMGLSAVSKSLSFSEESQVIADVREDLITEQIKEATEGSVEIVEETTVLRTTKATELAVTDRRLSGSGKLEENITEDLSEKVIRIEHIEAGASREDQVSVQQETEMHDLQTEGMFHSEETVEDTSNTTPIAEEALSVKESHKNQGSRDTLEVSPANGEPRDKITQEEHISTHNSPAEDENVTSENEEVKEDSATLVVYEEVFEVHTEVETLKQGDQGQVLRKTTIFSTKTVESNYIQQKSDKETNENTLQTIDIVGELAVTDPEPEESQVLSDDILVMEDQLKDEELQNEELTGNKYEFVVKDTILHPDTAETVNKRGHLLTESLTLEEVQISDHMSDDETEEPPVIPRRGRRKVNPKSTKQRQHKEEGEHTHEAEPIAGRSLGRKEADKKAVDKQMEDQNQEETDQSMDRTPETSAQELLVVEDGRTPGAHESEEDAITSTKVRIEINKDDIKEMPPEMDSEKQELTDYGNEETGAICGDNLDQPTSSVPDELQLTKDCEMPRLQQSRVILVDLKTGSDYVSLMVAGETIEVQCLASEREEVELTADEKMDKDPETALQPSTEEDNDDLEEVNGNKGKEDSSNENHEEEEPFIETIYLRSGRKIIKLGHQEHRHDDIAAVSTRDEDHEKETITNDGITGEDPVEEKQSAEQASTQPEINDEMRLEDEAPIHLQPSIQVSMVKISTEVEVEENKTDDGEIAGIENGDKSVDQREEKPKAEVKVMGDPSEQAMEVAGSETCPNEQAEPSKEVSEIDISAEVEVEENKTDDSGIAEIENGDKSVDQGEEKLKDMDVVSAEATTGTNSETRSNGEGENYLSETASAPMTVVEGDTDENEAPVVPTHICGSNGNTINASAGTIPLKCQIEENEEETRETHSGPDEPEPEQRLVIHAEEQVIEVPEGEEEELAEETTSMEKEIKIDGARDQIIGSESACLRGAESEKFNDEPPVEVLETGTEVYGTSRGMEAEITEIDVEPPTAAPEEDHLILFDEEAPTVTSKSQKSWTKRPKTTPKRTSRRRKKQGLQQYVAKSGDDKTQEKPEDPGETSQPHEPSGFITAKDLEESDMEESVEGDIISVESEKDISSNSELNKDEDGKEFNLEVEDNLSDDDGELIVMEKKVLRRRTVPALIITPQSKSRCHRIKEFLSEEEKTPQSALKKKPIKRKGTETTPGRRSKRRSRV
eukprot:XP_003974566.1 PREDICTED: microtubule-associated protein futsch-like [Takifugu rubripes]